MQQQGLRAPHLRIHPKSIATAHWSPILTIQRRAVNLLQPAASMIIGMLFALGCVWLALHVWGGWVGQHMGILVAVTMASVRLTDRRVRVARGGTAKLRPARKTPGALHSDT